MGKPNGRPDYARRQFLLKASLFFTSLLLVLPAGCSAFRGKKKKSVKNDAEFEEAVEDGLSEDAEISIFETERKKQSELSKFVAQNGKKTRNDQTTVRPGDDFLLSDKAKEIYANTER